MSIRAVHHLNCGTMCPIAGFLLGQHGLRGHMVCHCLLVETERDGLVLVDTGFGTRDVDGHTQLSRTFRTLTGPRLDPAETALAQLEARGYRAADVKHVVVTHLDLDHAGGLVDFPHAKIHLHAREHAAAMARTTYKERERYLPSQWAHGPAWEVYTEDGDSWRGLPAITRLRGLDADIGLVPMHGHTRGHSAVIVRDRARWLVHAGDAYFHHNSVASGGGGAVPLGFAAFERATQMIPAARRASVGALRQLREHYPDVAMFCAHDPAEYGEQIAAPPLAAVG
ncbi:MAG: MBL fold metallo-hydrolase [Deltaproteobacteria bacterium]|nr:MBL fold metallo-hydrolase [Deltaproteobacteria bacterium]